MLNKLNTYFLCMGFSAAFVACGSGGGGGSDGTSVDGSVDVNGNVFRVEASVTSDTCGERISPVNQLFTIDDGGSTVLVDTSMIELQGTKEGSGFTAGFSESNGDCVRDYQMNFTNIGGDGGPVTLTSKSTCGAQVCESRWDGTATLTGSDSKSLEKVRGETCLPAPSQVGFRPSLFECNGNAAVLMRGSYRNNYSVVVRRDGQYNDRDPNNPTCGTNRCSPFKTQKQINLPEYQVNCLGQTGFSANYSLVKRISVKYTAKVTNANDESQFNQYCLSSTTRSLN